MDVWRCKGGSAPPVLVVCFRGEVGRSEEVGAGCGLRMAAS